MTARTIGGIPNGQVTALTLSTQFEIEEGLSYWADYNQVVTLLTDNGFINSGVPFTTADHDKLDGIEALADVTDTTNVDAAGAVMETGDHTMAGALTVQGAFTSLGIDDNATGERLSISDTIMHLGTAGSNYVVAHASNEQVMTLSGGIDSVSGANLQLFGGAESPANDARFRSGTTVTLLWDDSANLWDFQGNAVTCGAFTSTGINDDTTGERWAIFDTSTRLGAAGGSYGISHVANDQSVNIQGGLSGATAGLMTLYGGSNVALGGDVLFRTGATTTLWWDSSVGDWDYQDNFISNVGNLALGSNAKQAAATNTLHIYNGTVPSGNIANGVMLYAEDVTASSELKVRNEAGTVTQLSMHGPTLFTAGPENPLGYVLKHSNSYIPSEVDPTKSLYQEVDIIGAVAEIERLSGKKFIWDGVGPDLENWENDQSDIVRDENNLRETKASKRREISIDAKMNEGMTREEAEAEIGAFVKPKKIKTKPARIQAKAL